MTGDLFDQAGQKKKKPAKKTKGKAKTGAVVESAKKPKKKIGLPSSSPN